MALSNDTLLLGTIAAYGRCFAPEAKRRQRHVAGVTCGGHACLRSRPRCGRSVTRAMRNILGHFLF
ncbi:MAG: hypothetical protein ACYS30_19615 [Planctomycetota bacterium]